MLGFDCVPVKMSRLFRLGKNSGEIDSKYDNETWGMGNSQLREWNIRDEIHGDQGVKETDIT